MHYEEPTPAETPNAIRDLANEVKLLKEQTKRLADAAMSATAEIPKLRRQVRQVQVFHQWFPTVTIAGAIVARLLWRL